MSLPVWLDYGGFRLGSLTNLNTDSTHFELVLTAPVTASLAGLNLNQALYLSATNLQVGAN